MATPRGAKYFASLISRSVIQPRNCTNIFVYLKVLVLYSKRGKLPTMGIFSDGELIQSEYLLLVAILDHVGYAEALCHYNVMGVKGGTNWSKYMNTCMFLCFCVIFKYESTKTCMFLCKFSI